MNSSAMLGATAGPTCRCANWVSDTWSVLLRASSNWTYVSAGVDLRKG